MLSFPIMSEEEPVPEWLAHLEKAKTFKLGHELGAGAPCMKCSYCPGLELHFWRKICKICSCSLQDHDYENEDFPQYDILFGDVKKRKFTLPFKGQSTIFDWIPLHNNDPSLVEEYMLSLPPEWRPIVGSAGSKYRKKQLEAQLPRYDVDIASCMPLNDYEEKKFVEYQNALRENVAGLAAVKKMNVEHSHQDTYKAVPAWVVNDPTSESVHFSPQHAEDLLKIQSACRKCLEPIKDNAVVVEANKLNNTVWHAECFTCNDCGELLVDLHYFHHDGKVYCGRDYAKAIKKPRCVACDELIFDKEYAYAEGHFYHNRHFSCAVCEKMLGGEQYLSKRGNILCLTCYQLQNQKTCVTCRDFVTPFEERLLVGSNVYHKKTDCFRCSVCCKPLEGLRISVRDSRILCRTC